MLASKTNSTEVVGALGISTTVSSISSCNLVSKSVTMDHLKKSARRESYLDFTSVTLLKEHESSNRGGEN